SLDYSAKSSAVTVNLGTGGVKKIGRGTGSTSSQDKLLGPDEDALWEITGAGSGKENGIPFSSFENPAGAANNQDGFIVRAGGSISGTIAGGASGHDGLAVEDPAHPGHVAVIIPDGTGGGTLAADAVYTGVPTITFSGMERPFYADTSV